MKKRIIGIVFAAVFVLLLGISVAGCGYKPHGTFYSLQEASDNGLLTRDDLLSIAYYNQNGTWGNEEVMGESFEPQPKAPAELDSATERALCRCYWEQNKTLFESEGITDKQMGVRAYLGTYNGYIVLIMGRGDVYEEAFRRYTIDGILFSISNYNLDIEIFVPDKEETEDE